MALVVDFGTANDAPPRESPPAGVRGTCVVVPDRSNGADVLATAGYAPRQDSSGLLCSLSGYPARECGVVVRRARTGSQPVRARHHDAGPDSEAAGLPRRPVLGRSDRPRVVRGTGSHPAGHRRLTPSSDAVGASTSPDAASSPVLRLPRARPDGRATTTAAAGPSDPPAGLLLGVGLVAVVGVAALARGRSTGAKDPS